MHSFFYGTLTCASTNNLMQAGVERRERIEKGSREGIEKETKRQFEEKEGLRETPPLLEFLDPTLQCSHCFFKSSGYDKLELKHENLFYNLIE